MKIEKLSVVLGEQIETNQQLIDQLKSQVAPEELGEIKRLLELSGAEKRRLSSKHLSPSQYLEKAFETLKKYQDEIEIVINTGIVKGVLEPAQGALYCQKLDLHQSQTFDITEACNSLVRGLQLAHLTEDIGINNLDILFKSWLWLQVLQSEQGKGIFTNTLLGVCEGVMFIDCQERKLW